MDKPYVSASRIAFFRSFVRFRKKLTVIGIIGHTQGVSKAINPPRNPAKKMNSQEVSVAVTVVSPKAFNSSITGVHKAASFVNALVIFSGLTITFSSFATGSGVVRVFPSSTTRFVSGCSFVTSSFSTTGASADNVSFVFLLSKAKLSRSGGKQVSSLQTMNSTSPSILNFFGLSIFTFCVKVTAPGNQRRSMANCSS